MQNFYQIRNNNNDKIYQYYQIDRKKKIVLYAPTFREHEFKSTLNSNILLEAIQEKTGYEFVLMLRCHPHVANTIFNESLNNKNILNVSDYVDMQELLCAADVLITDYSSCMWDFSFTYRPCFIYATDLSGYEKERNFHTPLSKWPFPIAENNNELKENIINFDEIEYIKQVKKHHQDLGSFENGSASKQVCELIKNICHIEV